MEGITRHLNLTPTKGGAISSRRWRSPQGLGASAGLLASILLASILLASDAWAGAHQLSGTHVTSKSPDRVWEILTAYAETCATGCRYERPHLVRIKKLEDFATDTAWYTWSHVANPLRDVTYFSRVTVRWDDDGGFELQTQQLDSSHREMIERLNEAHGLPHRPAFDTANTVTLVHPEGRKTVVHQKVHLTTSGVMDLWPSKVVDGIRDHMSSTFRNIGP